MTLEAFLRSLHTDTPEPGPPGWEVDWEDAPLKYKLYRGLPTLPLSSEVPLTLDGQGLPSKPFYPDQTGIGHLPAKPIQPDLASIGHFLWYAFGLTQLNHTCFTSSSMGQWVDPLQVNRRFIPSGGGLYPNELYIYLKTKDAPAGVYHYDAAHHRLVLLREGNFDSYLARALGERCDVKDCFGVVFVTTMFWKNFFKYNNFSYRLQGLDAGVLIGQLLEVAKRFKFTSGVYFQFLDRAMNHLLGLSDREESVYAAIPLSIEPAMTWFGNNNDEPGRETVRIQGREHGRFATADELCRELPAVCHDHYIRSRKIKEYLLLIQMNEASFQNSSASFRQVKTVKYRDSGVQVAYLPPADWLSYDLAAICRKRYSPEADFVLGKVTVQQLAVLLQEATSSFTYRNDLDGPYEKPEPRVYLYGSLYNVEGVPDGSYRYDSTAHALRRILPGDHRQRLQQGMYLDNVNLFQIPLCLHVAGDKEHLKSSLGYRGYRIQQMETGMLVQRLLLTASALGMGGRPLLGFNARNCDEIYKLALQEKTSLIQIPVSYYHQRPCLEGGLHS